MVFHMDYMGGGVTLRVKSTALKCCGIKVDFVDLCVEARYSLLP